MGMPITIEITNYVANEPFDQLFNYFRQVDERYSTYKADSEISRINKGLINPDQYSTEMIEVLRLCEETKQLSGGYFDIKHDDQLDPSGLVKGWAIDNAAKMLKTMGFSDFYVEAGGDIQVEGNNADGLPWQVGIRNPFNIKQIVKVVSLRGQGIATSGTYLRGDHIYNPKDSSDKLSSIKSLTVIGPNIFEADRLATAAYAMGKHGSLFLDALKGFESYQIDETGQATLTKGFMNYVA